MDNEDKTEAAPEIAALETKMGEIAEAVKGFAKVTERLDRVEAKLNRPGTTEIKADNDNAAETKAFMSFVRKGVERCTAEEVKSLTVTDDGTLAPPEFGSEILKLLRQFSPIRQYAKVVTIGGSAVKYPKRTGSTAAVWVDETEDRTESEPSYDQVTLTPFELATYVDVSNALLEDNAYNLQSELAADLAESIRNSRRTRVRIGKWHRPAKGHHGSCWHNGS